MVSSTYLKLQQNIATLTFSDWYFSNLDGISF